MELDLRFDGEGKVNGEAYGWDVGGGVDFYEAVLVFVLAFGTRIVNVGIGRVGCLGGRAREVAP